MPVSFSYVPVPSRFSARRICVSVVRRSITARRTAPPAPSTASRVFDHAGRDAEAVRRGRILRAIAHEDAARDQSVDERACALAAVDEHEICRALPVAQTRTVERGVEQSLGFGDLTEIPRRELAIRQRRTQSRDGDDVEIEQRHDEPNRFEQCRLRNHDADAHAGEAVRFRKRAPDDDVRIGQTLFEKVLTHEIVIRLVDEHQRVPRPANRPRGWRPSTPAGRSGCWDC